MPNELYRRSGAERLGLAAVEFTAILEEIARRYLPPGSLDFEKESLWQSLKIEDLALARACAAGSECAWDEFLVLYREKLRAVARVFTRDESRARELADSLHADLYGTRTRDGQRISKLSSYSGRGSLEGWLRTVLAQQYVDEYRRVRHSVSLNEEAAGNQTCRVLSVEASIEIDPRLAVATDQALATISSEDRYLLACYYLDDLTLAQIARLLRVHESTISRKVTKLVHTLREHILAGLEGLGMSAREAQEAVEVDVRDVAVDIRGRLTQESGENAFSQEKPLLAEKVEG